MSAEKEIVIFSTELIRNIILLCVGAILTGIGVPMVKAVMDWRSAKRQKILESELARQKEIIDSQIKFLSDFSELVWKMVFEVFKVSYAYAWESKELQQKTYTAYGPISWELITKIRSTISAASRLTSPATQREIMKVYEWLIELDERLSTMTDEDHTQKEWEEFHETKFDEAGGEIDSAISRLATDLKLYAGTMSKVIR
jgi:hypothetical protein